MEKLRELVKKLRLAWLCIAALLAIALHWEIHEKPYNAQWECESEEDYQELLKEVEFNLEFGDPYFANFCSLARECEEYFDPKDFPWPEHSQRPIGGYAQLIECFGRADPRNESFWHYLWDDVFGSLFVVGGVFMYLVVFVGGALEYLEQMLDRRISEKDK